MTPSSALSSTVSTLQAQGLSSAGAQAQDAYTQALGQSTAGVVSFGVTTIASILANGWPSSTAAQGQQLVNLYEGAFSAAGFPEVSAAISALQWVAQDVLAPVLEQLGLVGTGNPPCTCSGDCTPSQLAILTGWGIYDVSALGPFATIAVPAMASMFSLAEVCSGPVFLPGDLLGALAALWNAGGAQAQAPAFCPVMLGAYADPGGLLFNAEEYSSEQGGLSAACNPWTAGIPYLGVGVDPSTGDWSIPTGGGSIIPGLGDCDAVTLDQDARQGELGTFGGQVLGLWNQGGLSLNEGPPPSSSSSSPWPVVGLAPPGFTTPPPSGAAPYTGATSGFQPGLHSGAGIVAGLAAAGALTALAAMAVGAVRTPAALRSVVRPAARLLSRRR